MVRASWKMFWALRRERGILGRNFPFILCKYVHKRSIGCTYVLHALHSFRSGATLPVQHPSGPRARGGAHELSANANIQVSALICKPLTEGCHSSRLPSDRGGGPMSSQH